MLVVLGLEVAQGDVFEFAFDVVQTQFVGDLGVEVEALPALLAPLFAGKNFEAAHHLEPVGQLDQDHARIFRIGNDQFAEIFRLLPGGFQADVGDVAQTYGHAEHLLAEAVPDLVRQPQERLFVLSAGRADYVVENGGHDRVASQPDLLQPDPRYFGGVVQHRRAVVSYLRSGMFGSIFQGAVGCGRLVGRERSADRAAQLVITGQIHFPESFTVFQK